MYFSAHCRVCVIHHFARIDNHITLFETLWFLMVTLTTVGYGDIAPTHWTGRILVILFILSAVAFLFPLVEKLHESFQWQQRLNNSVGYAQTGKSHIVICSTELKPLVLRDLLTEFYSDPSNYVSGLKEVVSHCPGGSSSSAAGGALCGAGGEGAGPHLSALPQPPRLVAQDHRPHRHSHETCRPGQSKVGVASLTRACKL